MATPLGWLSRRVGDFTTAQAGGRLSAVLFVLCGALVLLAAPLLPRTATANLPGVAACGLGAFVSGLVIWRVPWHRWQRSSTLWLFVPAMSLIAVHNVLTAADGYRYDVFFLVVFAWAGLVHPPGTALRLSPTLAIAYLVPALFTPVGVTTLVSGLAYVLPVALVIGESVAWVSERVRLSEQGLRASEERFRSLIQHAADMITLVDADGLITYDSPAVQIALGYSPTERIGQPASRFLEPSQVEALRNALEAPSRDGVSRLEVAVSHADGSWRWCDVTLRDLLDDPAVQSIVVNLTDITARKMAAEALAEGEASFRSLFASNPHPMWVVDRQTFEFLEVNESAVRHYGYTRSRFLAMAMADISVDAASTGEAPGRPTALRHRLADGRLIDVETTTHQITFRNRAATLVAVQDVTDRNALDAQLRHQAFHDSLTNLANRALFTDRMDHALSRRLAAGETALLLIDLDGFKTINDSLGHITGDDLLVLVAERLRAAVRPSDTVARLGGDEFGVLIEGLHSTEDAVAGAERILAALATPFTVGRNDLTIGASIGIAFAEDAASPGELLRNADVAMYRAKAEGKGTFRLFQTAMHGAALNRLELDSDLRRAIEQGQFELYFQPMVDLRRSTVVGCEALVRWHHPRRGLLAPDTFINAAEESGLIVPLGRWVLEAACAHASTLGALGVSVNLSARQLADPTLPAEVAAVLATTGLRPEQLTLEITESVLMHDTSTAIDCLGHLRTLGVRLSIDDFGTGYSSLSYLRTFCVDEVKIDKSFIDSLPDDPQGVSLVEGIIRLASTLGLSTVAEGIETAGQLDTLVALGCDTAQGYRLGRPMPGALLRKHLSPNGPGSLVSH